MIKTKIVPSHSSNHLQGHFFFLKFSLEYAFDSSNTMLKVLVILFIILLFGFGPQGPMGLMQLVNRDLQEFGFKFEKMEIFNPEAATGGAL